MSSLLEPLLSLPGWVVLLAAGGLAFAEAAIFVGFVLPGETAVVLAGVAASQGRVSLPLLVVVVVVAAIAGDSVGYEVGRHAGPRVLDLPLLRSRRGGIERARAFLREKGGRAVFIGRWTAFLRAVTPGLAGVSHMPYRRFLAFNAAGGVAWGTTFCLVGYLAGASYHKVEQVAGRASLVLLGVVVAVLLIAHVRRMRRERALEEAVREDDVDAEEPDAPVPHSR